MKVRVWKLNFDKNEPMTGSPASVHTPNVWSLHFNWNSNFFQGKPFCWSNTRREQKHAKILESSKDMQIQSHHSNQRTFCRALHGMEEFAINTVLKEVLGPSDCQRILLNVELLIVMHSYSFFFFYLPMALLVCLSGVCVVGFPLKIGGLVLFWNSTWKC